jgi:hypothetical protein
LRLPDATNPTGKNFTGTVEVTNVVPEPVSIILVGTGLFAMAALRRRRGRNELTA